MNHGFFRQINQMGDVENGLLIYIHHNLSIVLDEGVDPS